MAGTPQTKRIPFGMSDITVGEGANVMNFNGKDNLQAEGGELVITPQFTEVKVADFGESVYDKVLVGWEAKLTITAAEESIDNFELAMAATVAITDTTSGAKVGLMDAALGTSLRSKAKRVKIHPRVLGADQSLDITIYKMASDGDFNRSSANEQGNVTIEMSMFIRDNFDATKPGNFFYLGAKDPNAAA